MIWPQQITGTVKPYMCMELSARLQGMRSLPSMERQRLLLQELKEPQSHLLWHGRRRTSISAMFSNYIASLEEEPSKDNELPPITKQILEMGAELPQVQSDWDYRDELSDSLSEKYGIK